MAPLDIVGRIDRARLSLNGACDTLVVTHPANVRWLTGFSASNIAVAITPSKMVVATDRRYHEALETHVHSVGLPAQLNVGRNVVELVIKSALQADDSATIGLEAHHVTWQRQQSAADIIGEKAALVDTTGLVENARAIKDHGELDRLRRAAAIADHALNSVISDLAPGLTERQISQRLDALMAQAGADGPSFPTIVASGPNSALPHAVPSERRINDRDLLVIDMGSRVEGYGSDMTRTFAIGSFTTETEAMYQAVVDAQRAGVGAVAPGTVANVVDAACRELLADRGMAAEFIHGSGHGIGLEIHEKPFLSANNGSDILCAGHVVTVEPGVYRRGVGGVRIEDSLIVTADGCQPITLSAKEPLIRL